MASLVSSVGDTKRLPLLSILVGGFPQNKYEFAGNGMLGCEGVLANAIKCNDGPALESALNYFGAETFRSQVWPLFTFVLLFAIFMECEII